MGHLIWNRADEKKNKNKKKRSKITPNPFDGARSATHRPFTWPARIPPTMGSESHSNWILVPRDTLICIQWAFQMRHSKKKEKESVFFPALDLKIYLFSIFYLPFFFLMFFLAVQPNKRPNSFIWCSKIHIFG